MEWAYVLVIILSLFLALFLLLGVVLVILLIRVTLQIKSVTESAQRTATTIEEMVVNVGSAKTMSVFTKGILKQALKLRKLTKRRK